MKFHSEVGAGAGGEPTVGLLDCAVRVGTASEGMSRLARLVPLQRRECTFERIHFGIEIVCQRLIPVGPSTEPAFWPQRAGAGPHTRRS